MTSIPTADYLAEFSAALVSEIKADMGRRELSFRGLAMLLGENPQYVTSRLAGGNPRTGKRVDLSVTDLIVIARALGTDAWALLSRAREIAGPSREMQLPSNAAGIADDLAKKRAQKDVSGEEVNLADLRDEPSAAAPERTNIEGDEEPELP